MKENIPYIKGRQRQHAFKKLRSGNLHYRNINACQLNGGRSRMQIVELSDEVLKTGGAAACRSGLLRFTLIIWAARCGCRFAAKERRLLELTGYPASSTPVSKK